MLPTKLNLFLLFWIMCNTSGHTLKSNTKTVNSDGNVIHCYCNLPSCIMSSYMCKTEKTENGCFKRFSSIAEQYEYGCLDSNLKQTVCPKSNEITNIPNSPGYYNQCCYSDMCNHDSSDNPITSNDIRIDESDEDKIKELLMQKKVNRSSSFNYYTNSEVWFRAVLIAVPICGLMILLILIFVAIRMLRSDFQEDRSTSSKLLKRKNETVAVNSGKVVQPIVPEKQNFQLPKSKYNLFDKKFSFVFKHYPSEKYLNVKPAVRYEFIPKDKYSNNLNFCIPKMPEKYDRHNLNILKLPHKFDESTQKGCKNTNESVNNNHCYSINTAVTLNSNLINYKKCNFTQ